MKACSFPIWYHSCKNKYHFTYVFLDMHHDNRLLNIFNIEGALFLPRCGFEHFWVIIWSKNRRTHYYLYLKILVNIILDLHYYYVQTTINNNNLYMKFMKMSLDNNNLFPNNLLLPSTSKHLNCFHFLIIIFIFKQFCYLCF